MKKEPLNVSDEDFNSAEKAPVVAALLNFEMIEGKV